MVSVKGTSALSIIVAIVVLIVLIWNVVYIYNVRKSLTSGNYLGLSATGADILFWVDIILIIIVGIYLIYNLFLIFTTKEQRTSVIESFTESNKGTTKLPIIRSKAESFEKV
jgi:hypothetical protein